MKKYHSKPNAWTMFKMHLLRTMGKTGTDIATRLDMSKSAVYRYLKK